MAASAPGRQRAGSRALGCKGSRRRQARAGAHRWRSRAMRSLAAALKVPVKLDDPGGARPLRRRPMVDVEPDLRAGRLLVFSRNGAAIQRSFACSFVQTARFLAACDYSSTLWRIGSTSALIAGCRVGVVR